MTTHDEARSIVTSLKAHLDPEDQPLLDTTAKALYEHGAIPNGWDTAHPDDVIAYTGDAFVALKAIRDTRNNWSQS